MLPTERPSASRLLYWMSHLPSREKNNNNKRERLGVVDSDYVFDIIKFSYTISWHKTFHKQTARIKLGPFVQFYMQLIYIHSSSGNKQQCENWIHSHITDGSAYSCELWDCPLYAQPAGRSTVFYFTRPRHRTSLSACSTMPNTLSKKKIAFLINSFFDSYLLYTVTPKRLAIRRSIVQTVIFVARSTLGRSLARMWHCSAQKYFKTATKL